MNLCNRILHSMNWRLSRTDSGIAILRMVRWIVPVVWPYRFSGGSAPALGARFAVEARASTVEGAGTGLFALEEIPAHRILGEYDGDRIRSLMKWLRLPDKDYVMFTDIPWVIIDGKSHPGMMMRYVNHHFDANRRNLIRTVEGERVYFTTTRDIQPGEEFFIDYGELYWKMRGVRYEPDGKG